jgi:hypothetical protein
MIPVFFRRVGGFCVLLGCYAASSGSSAADVSGQPIGSIFLDLLTLEDGTDRFPETSVQEYHSTLRNIPEEGRSLMNKSFFLSKSLGSKVAGVFP